MAALSSGARGLLVACHPLPTAFVTAFVTAYAATVGLAGGRLALLALAVLLGQLSIGWCNDAVDAERDRAAGRRDKPVAVGQVARRAVAVAAGAALAGCLLTSFALGPRAGIVHGVVVAAGWAYDLGLKGTLLSGVPYVVAFGLLPAVGTWAMPAVHAGWPPVPVMWGGALLGLAAHFANTVGDTAADAATGVRGLPQRLGPARSLTVTALLVGSAAVVLAVGAPDPSPAALAVLAAGALGAAGGMAISGGAAGRGRLAFRLTLAAVGLVVVGFLLAA